MQPSQEKAQTSKETEENSPGPIQSLHSDLTSKKLRRPVKKLANPQGNNPHRCRPKLSRLQIKRKQHFKFAPFLAKTLQIKGKTRFPGGSSFCNEKHNLIMVCPHGKPP